MRTGWRGNVARCKPMACLAPLRFRNWSQYGSSFGLETEKSCGGQLGSVFSALVEHGAGHATIAEDNVELVDCFVSFGRGSK